MAGKKLVYLVTISMPYEGETIEGVYATEEAAKSACDRVNWHRDGDTLEADKDGYNSFLIRCLPIQGQED